MVSIASKLRFPDGRRLLNLFRGRPAMLQIAALCYRPGPDGHEVLLILSRGGGNWILPKGWPIRKKTSPETAAIEAFEEAGVRGEVSAQPIGTYQYSKSIAPGLSLPCTASAYAIRVEEQVEDFPEKNERKQVWLLPGEAATRVKIPELAALLRTFHP